MELLEGWEWAFLADISAHAASRSDPALDLFDEYEKEWDSDDGAIAELFDSYDKVMP